VPGLGTAPLAQVEELEELCGRHRTPVEASEEVQDLHDGQLGIQLGRLERHADALLERVRVAGNVDAQDLQAPRVGLAQPFEHLDRRRLAGAVGAKQPEDLTAGDTERDAVDRPDVAVALANITDADDRVALSDDGVAGRRSRGHWGLSRRLEPTYRRLRR
jgi:hypothetical protein